MMSLFASFDLYWYSTGWIVSLLMVFALFNFFFASSSSKILMDSISHVFSIYCSSLMNFDFKAKNFFMYTMILTIFLLNIGSIFPYIFAANSHMGLVLFTGLTFWGASMLVVIKSNLKVILAHWIPAGSPLGLSWFLFVIEIVSSLIRPVTLSIRLVANILAGHLLLSLLSQMIFQFNMMFPVYIILNCVEFFVGTIQAYIFVTMMQLYYSEV